MELISVYCEVFTRMFTDLSLCHCAWKLVSLCTEISDPLQMTYGHSVRQWSHAPHFQHEPLVTACCYRCVPPPVHCVPPFLLLTFRPSTFIQAFVINEVRMLPCCGSLYAMLNEVRVLS